MPEILEVRKYAALIRGQLLGKTLKSIKILAGRYKKHGAPKDWKLLTKRLPLKLTGVVTRGKFMALMFSNNYSIGVSLGLSGGWFYKKGQSEMIHGHPTTGLNKHYGKKVISQYIMRAKKHINLEFKFNGSILSFYDQLSFGSLTVFKNRDMLDRKLKSLGLDVMDISLKDFKDRLSRASLSNKFIGNVIVNQKIISGIGNYLRADILWLSKISPFRKVKNLTNTEIVRLYHNIKVLTWGIVDRKKAVKLGILTKKSKLPGDYNRAFFVYNYEKDPRGRDVKYEKLYEGSQVRYIYWVPKYQK